MLKSPALQPRSGTAPDLTEALALQQRELLLDDRERIATDLHDHVIGRLLAAELNLQSVAGVLGPGPLAARLQASVDDLDATIKQICTTIFQLHDKSPAGESGVASRLLGVVITMSPALGFDPGLRFSGLGLALPEGIEADLLAVLSEALTNVARHARASCADVDVTETPDRLVIKIADDGIGIGRAAGRSGLATMRRRAVDHDGAFSVEPRQPSGTRLTWTVPLQQHPVRQHVGRSVTPRVAVLGHMGRWGRQLTTATSVSSPARRTQPRSPGPAPGPRCAARPAQL